MSLDRGEWLEERLLAEMWWCGDEDCDCVQPQIVRRKPNLVAGYPWLKWDLVWEGTFTTGEMRMEERTLMDRLTAELAEACAELGIPVPASTPL